MDKTPKHEEIKNTAAVNAPPGEQNTSFTSNNKGTVKGSLENGLLVPSKDVNSIIVDGHETTTYKDESGVKNYVIPGIEDICVMIEPKTPYDFVIHIHGKCPEGANNNHMTFTDESGDTYYIRIISPVLKDHTIDYSSSNGAINKIEWDI